MYSPPDKLEYNVQTMRCIIHRHRPSDVDMLLLQKCPLSFNGLLALQHQINCFVFSLTRQAPAAERVPGADQEHAGPGQPLRVYPEGRQLVAALLLPDVGRRRGRGRSGFPDGPQLRRRPP